MKFGRFNDLSKEYEIDTPYTPLPWINYLGNKDFFSIISNTGGGYSFYKDAKLQRITRYRYNNVPLDSGGKYYYIKDESTTFNPGFMPTQTILDSYKCRHGMGYTIFNSSKNNLDVKLLCFVPLNYPCEINSLKIRNNNNISKKIKIFSFVEWCLYNTIDDSTNFQRNLNIGEVEIENSTIYHKSEYRERRNHYSFFSVNEKIDGFDSDRDSFLGPFRGFSNPICVENGYASNSIASGWSPIASHYLELTLAPNEEKELIFILGFIENDDDNKFYNNNLLNKDKANEIINYFSISQNVTKEFKKLQEYWDQLFSILTVKTGNEKLDRMANIWNQYQCMITFNMSRSASYFESGTGRGMGFRDSCQDILGFVHLIPESSRQRILDIAAIQFEDGSTYHQYQPLTKKGNADIGSGFNDDPLWLIACTAAYIKETGDESILFEKIPFNNQAGTEEPLYIHLQKSINYTISNLGPHGIPLIGRADWNDCLNLNCFSKTPGESFQTTANYESHKAESIFIGAMFVLYGKEYVQIFNRYIDKDEANRVLSEINKINNSLEKYGWDGKWFIRAYDAYLNKVGSKSCDEGKIYVEPQGFCVMAGIGGKEYADSALKSVKEYLENDYGLELLNPCYTKYHEELGEISSYPPGYKENGSVFCHNNPWVTLAYIKNGQYDEAFNLYIKNCPAYLEEKSEIHRTEPYVYSQTIAGRDAKNYGEAKNSWLTGTASWSMVALSQGILGIIPEYDGLKIEPHLPSSISELQLTRIFRGSKYSIKVLRNSNIKNSIYVNGKVANSNIVPPMKKGKCDVIVYL